MGQALTSDKIPPLPPGAAYGGQAPVDLPPIPPGAVYMGAAPGRAGFIAGGATGPSSGASGSFAPYADLTPQKVVDTIGTIHSKGNQAAVNAVKGLGQSLYNTLDPRLSPTERLKNNPIVGAVKGAVSGVVSAPTNLQDLYDAVKRGDYEGIASSATKVLTENVPAIWGAVEGVGGLMEGPGAAAVDASRLKTYNKSISNMGTVIRDGFKNMSGGEAGTIYQPYVQSFLKRAGVDLDEILPEKGDTATLNRGGTGRALNKINETLKEDWKASGRDPAKFVPYDDVHTAIADGAVNEAHAPIANAIRAARNVPANGVKVGVNPQYEIINELEAQKAGLSDIERKAMGSTFDEAIEDVRKRGTTIGGLDDIKQEWNHKAGRLHKGTNAQQSEAQASAAMVYDIGANAIRAKMYPVLENIVDRPGATSTLRQAGIDEAVAIRARNGIEISKIRNSNLGDTVAGQRYMNYLRDGITATRVVTSPIQTGTALLGRLSKENPMGQFNRAFKAGIGDMSSATLRNPAATLRNPELGLENPLVQGPSSIVPTPFPSAPGNTAPNPIPFSAPHSPIGTGLPIGQSLPSMPVQHPLTQGWTPVMPTEPVPLPVAPETAPPSGLPAVGKQKGAAAPRNATGGEAAAPYTVKTEMAKPPAPPPSGLPEGKGQAKTSAPSPSTKTASEHVGTSEKPVEKVSGYPQGEKQSGPSVPKKPDMPASAKDYFSALEEDAAAEESGVTKEEAAASSKAVKKALAPKPAPAPEKSAAAPEAKTTPAKPKAEPKPAAPKAKVAAPKPKPAPKPAPEVADLEKQLKDAMDARDNLKGSPNDHADLDAHIERLRQQPGMEKELQDAIWVRDKLAGPASEHPELDAHIEKLKKQIEKARKIEE